MSLINQMLKDIDERRGPPSSDSALRAGLIGSPRVESRSSRTPVSIGLGLGSLLVIGVVMVRSGLPGQRHLVAEMPPPAQSILAAEAAPAASVNVEAPASPPHPIPAARTPARPSQTESAAKHPPLPEKAESSGSVAKVITPRHQSANLYSDAVALIRQGRNIDAQGVLERALLAYPENHDARLVLARLMIDMRQTTEAKKILLEGLQLDPGKIQFSMSLAHVYMQSVDLESAIDVLQKGLTAAADDPGYHALLAALLQRTSRHDEAVKHYVVALRKAPDSANWLVGLAISLQAQRQFVGAGEAYQRAIDLGLSPQLAQFSQERLRQLGR